MPVAVLDGSGEDVREIVSMPRCGCQGKPRQDSLLRTSFRKIVEEKETGQSPDVFAEANARAQTALPRPRRVGLDLTQALYWTDGHWNPLLGQFTSNECSRCLFLRITGSPWGAPSLDARPRARAGSFVLNSLLRKRGAPTKTPPFPQNERTGDP